MFLTDRDPIVFADIVAIDPEVSDIATTESIPTSGNSSFIHQAVMEVGNKIMSVMQNFSYPWMTGAGGYATQMGMLQPWYDSTPAPRIRLGQIVMESDTSLFDSPIMSYLKYIALRNFYEIASNRNMNDRYDAKKIQYQKDIEHTYWPNLKASGISISWVPLPAPAALYEQASGTWTSSNVSAVASSESSGGVFDVAITWFSPVLNTESGPSVTQTITVAADSALQINISSLNVPNTVTQYNIVTSTGANISAWNVYVGLTGQTLYFQGQVPIGTTTYTLPSDPVLSGKIVGVGQQRDCELTILNLFSRC
jgi:hypothetical protein